MRLARTIAGAMVLVALMVTARPCQAQPSPFAPDFSGQGQGQGFWAEVISVTPTWLVLQNQRGQQFPISFANTNGRYMIRTPIAFDRITPGSVAEVVGFTMPNGGMRTGHIDVYDDALSATALPGNQAFSANGVPNDGLTTVLTFNWLLLPNLVMGVSTPGYRHVVGPILTLNPLTLGAPGNQTVAIAPFNNNIYVTQLSAETRSFGRVRKGDTAWIVLNRNNPTTPRSLNVSELVIYQSGRP